MLFRILSILTLGTLVFSINASALAQATSVLPTCNPFAGGWIYPSPTAAQDNTFFAAGEWAMPGGYVRYLLKSADRGLTWQRTSDLPFIENYRARIDFSQNYAVDQTLSVTFKTGTNISTDGGQTWRVVTFPRPGPNAFALGDAQHLYLGYGREIPPNSKVPMELIFSSDGGQTWQTIPMGFETDEIAVSPEFAHDRTLLIALGLYHYNGGLRISTDAGLTWLAADAGNRL